jgi:hypothetical protein
MRRPASRSPRPGSLKRREKRKKEYQKKKGENEECAAK